MDDGLERLDAGAGSFAASSYDAKNHTVDMLMVTGQRVQRWYGFLELDMSPGAVDLSRVAAGKVHVFDSHNTDSIMAIAGNVLSARLDGDRLIGKVKFAQTELGQLAEGMVSRGELTGASIGFAITSRQKISKEEDAVDIYRAVKWQLYELSLTGIPAVASAGALSVESPPGLTATERTQPMADETTAAAAAAQNEALKAHGRETLAAERLRVKTIRERTKAAGLPAEVADRLVDDGVETAHVGDKLVDELAARGVTRTAPAVVIIDHTDPVAIRERMSDALALHGLSRIGANDALRDKTVAPAAQAASREFMTFGILDMFAGIARARGEKVPERQTKANRYDHLTEMLSLSTSDFPLLLASAANKVLLPAYTLANPTFKRIFARKTFNDFKAHHFLRAGDFPDLLAKGETGEFKYGTLSESDQQVTAAEYGRILRISRRIIINDDLGAFADIPAMAGRRAAVFENSLAFKQFALNSNAGPNITEGGVATAMWEATTHKNYTSSGTAISVAALGVGRTAIQKQTSLDGEYINLMPAILLTPPEVFTVGQQFTSSSYIPTQGSNINPFAGALEAMADANLSAISTTAWYLFCNPGMAETFIYGYLAGQEGPRFGVQQGFETEGVDLKLALDIGVGAVDFRGTYKNAGA